MGHRTASRAKRTPHAGLRAGATGGAGWATGAGARLFFLVLTALLAACASGPKPAAAPRAGIPDKVPDEIATALATVARREGVPADGRVLLQQMELGPSGPRVLLASGTRELCADGNCPYGLFADDSGRYRALLLVMAVSPPKPQAVSRLGYPDISVTANDTGTELRNTQLQWDGRTYRSVGCRLLHTMSDASRGCVPTRAEQAPVVEGPPMRYCRAMRSMIDRETPPDGQTLLANAFEIRADGQARVEGVRMAGRQQDSELDLLVRCLRNAGAGFERMKDAPWSRELASTGWVARKVKSRGGPVSVALSATFVPVGDYTLISFAVFGAGAVP
ncbi:hypothetical protein ACFX58_14445 [Sphingomonas sp. NCPPB 2930]